MTEAWQSQRLKNLKEDVVAVDGVLMSDLELKYKRDLTDEIGKLLLTRIQTQKIKDEVCSLVRDYVKKNNLNVNPQDLFKTVDWHVEVQLKR